MNDERIKVELNQLSSDRGWTCIDEVNPSLIARFFYNLALEDIRQHIPYLIEDDGYIHPVLLENFIDHLLKDEYDRGE